MGTDNQTYESIRQEYRRRIENYETTKTRIDAQIERLEKKRRKNTYPHWTDCFIRPVMDELVRLTPEIEWKDYSELSVYGLRADCPIFGKHISSGRTVGITFTCNERTLFYDTGKRENRHAPGTLGNLNGFNNITAPAESMDDLVGFIRHQSTPLDGTFNFIVEGARVCCTSQNLSGEFTVRCVERHPDSRMYFDTSITLTDGTRDYIAYPEELSPIV